MNDPGLRETAAAGEGDHLAVRRPLDGARVGRVRDPLAVAKEPGTRRRPVQAKEIERQVRVQEGKAGPIRVGRGRLDARLNALRTPEVAEDFAAVRRPGVAGGAVDRSDLN